MEDIIDSIPEEFTMSLRQQLGKVLLTTTASFIAVQTVTRVYEGWLIKKHISANTSNE